MSLDDTRAARPDELERAMQEFSRIGANLVGSYDALAERAARVEQELAVANAELGQKVAELDALTQHLEAILEALPTGVVVRDSAGRITAVNQAAQLILEQEADSLIGSEQHELLDGPADGRPQPWSCGRGTRRVLTHRRAALASSIGRVELLDDRTELTELTERVHARDKMTAMGTLAGGVAHEIRNPLNAVQGFAALLLRELEPGSRAAHRAQRIVDGVAETDTIIAGLLSFARADSLHEEMVDPQQLVDDAVRGALGEDREGVELTLAVEPEPFAGDRIKLRQALRNLVANAHQIQAREGQARIAITLRREADETLVVVDDAGPGFTPEVARRALDPFYTTRAEGTGLGLALVATIAELHGGSARIHPEPGPLGGARISLRLPRRAAGFPQSADHAPDSGPPSRPSHADH